MGRPGEAPGTAVADGCEVSLQNPGRRAGVELRRLRPWLRRLVAELAPSAASFTARLTSNREVRELNRRFRERDRPTDVLSFPGGPTPDGRHLGDVVIALPTARRQAAARRHSLERELRTLLLHGVLHCMGGDHETDGGEMERLEARLRRQWVTREA